MSWGSRAELAQIIAQAKLDMGDTLVNVVHTTVGADDGLGTTTGDTSVTRTALVAQHNRKFTNNDGREVLSQHKILFLEPVTVNQADKMVLEDGRTGPILNISGVDNGGGAYFTEVILGQG